MFGADTESFALYLLRETYRTDDVIYEITSFYLENQQDVKFERMMYSLHVSCHTSVKNIKTFFFKVSPLQKVSAAVV